MEKYLTVDREAGRGSGVRGFGTLDSPGSTTRLCMMVIPFALFLGVRNPMFKMPLVFAGLAVFGILGLVLTFTRVYFILAAVQCGLVFLIMARDRILKRQEVTLLVMLGVAVLAAISPKLYEQFTIRADSVSVRFLQYEAAGRMILDHPVFGVGINNATGLKPNYVDFTFNKRYADTQFYLEPTHNMYLSMASEIGVIGALFFLAFFGRAGWQAWRQSRDSPDPEIRMVASALVVVFITVAVNGFMDPLQEYSALLLLWLYAGIIQNLPMMADPKKAEVRAPARKARTYGAAVSAPAR